MRQAGAVVVGEAAALAVFAVVAGDDVSPVAEIASPADNAVVTAPVAITGTATDANFLRYEVAIRPAGGSSFKVIAESAFPIAGGVLAAFDPTVLANGTYIVRLSVLDLGGNVTTDEATYVVDGGIKIGPFSVTFIDLSVLLAGIPIEISRTYDSRELSPGEFGFGWTLGVRTLDLQINRRVATWGWRIRQSPASGSVGLPLE